MDVPLWFGPADRSLFAFATVPDDGRASGAVVLCPPLGLEGLCARRTFATLGKALAAAGILTLRFDYDGTGDSVGSDEDPDRIVSWMSGIHHAVALVRQSGAPKVAVVGMRLGATMAATAMSQAGPGAPEGSIDGLVLWDPCASGRSYLRAQRALHAFGLEAREQDDGSVEAPGVVFNAGTVVDLSSLNLGTVEGPLARRILLLVRQNQSSGSRALEQFASTRPVEHGVAHGQEHLVDVKPDVAVVPSASVDALAIWLRETLAGGASLSRSPAETRPSWGRLGPGPSLSTPCPSVPWDSLE